jgi:uncharacterized protein involved in type VI secretion and phage assembly
MHRIKVNYPTDHDTAPETTWVRQLSPNSGKQRGLVILPDVGTEVVIGFSYRTLTPYMIGAVYNGGDDKPKPYANEDGNDDHRRFWSRNSHWIDFDDTSGAERIEIKSTSENNAIYQELHSANKIITQKVEKHIIHEAKETVSFKCKDWKLEATQSIKIEAGTSAVFRADTSAKWESSGISTYKASKVDINGGSPGSPSSPSPSPRTATRRRSSAAPKVRRAWAAGRARRRG